MHKVIGNNDKNFDTDTVPKLSKGNLPFSMTFSDSNPNFKITPLFDAEYLRNGTSIQIQLQWNTKGKGSGFV